MEEELNEIALSALLTRNRDRLTYEEERMKKGLQMFAESLRDIRATKCWRARGQDYTSFDDYCRRKLGFSEQRACQIITAGNTVKCLQDAIGDKEQDAVLKTEVALLPEKAVRALNKVPVKKAVGILRKIDKKEKITEVAIHRELGHKPKAKARIAPRNCPHCGGIINP